MNVLEVHRRIIEDYARYIRSFISISDPEIQAKVDEELAACKLWPEPLLQFNPAFKQRGNVADLARDGVVHPQVANVFTGYSLHQHQFDAMQLGAAGKDFVVTSGTGSGKSLTYIGTIFSHLLANPGSKGVAAVIVYPLNALINSQTEEFRKYQANYKRATGNDLPVTFGQYTGQEDESRRKAMQANPPQILLTNYMMLELLLTRLAERSIRDAIYANLRYLVFDELHTYRGRQGADVAMLIRRIRAKATNPITCIGTSATMVSGGTVDDQRRRVAEVASTLFGKAFEPSQIVTEQLEPSLQHAAGPVGGNSLAAAIRQGITPTADLETLRTHPVALWLEHHAALEHRDGIWVRRRPRSVAELASQLAEASGEPIETCRVAVEGVLLWISTINAEIQRQGRRGTVLPFRLHQFISQTGSVYTTLDQGPDRFITLEPGIYKADAENQKPIFPNVFSRSSGHPFICVTRVGDRLVPREFMQDSQVESTGVDGYLILGEVWNPDEDLDALPESWFDIRKSGRKPNAERAAFFPQRIHFDELGNCSDDRPLGQTGWFMRAPLLFDPTGGTFFDPKTRESTKLAKLGSEGRSTSTTITAFSILAQLRDAGYSLRDQKLLSFTDNRQDAALQAGHFNDFVQVVRLRAAIHKALRTAPGNRLKYNDLGPAIDKALSLPFSIFAKPDAEPELGHVRQRYEETFQTFLLYRALADLRRSWRIVLPNLEQCALLSIEYEGLDQTAAKDDFWSKTPLVRDLDHRQRHEFLFAILEFFRLEFAIHSANFLEYAKLRESEKNFRERLRSPWTLDEGESLESPCVVRLEPLSKKSRMSSVSMGPQSGLGKFIKQTARRLGLDSTDFQGKAYGDFVQGLMERLANAGFLHKTDAKTAKEESTSVYQLTIDHLVWKLGDGKTVKSDAVKQRSFREVTLRPNAFFAGIYSQEFSATKQLIAADHTGQLEKDARLDREDRFRCDWWQDADKKVPDDAKIRSQSISALFCSPTMELGVDIGGLSVVHLRNAPPNSANYAQRSGRAGRSGQGALVFTYCSTFSPHDRHYFKQQAELVAGAVQPPRLDLCNKELLLTHLNALAVSEIGLPGLDTAAGQSPSLASLVDMNAADKPILQAVRLGLQLSPQHFQTVRAGFTGAIKDFAHILATRGSQWYSDAWVDTSLSHLADQLDASLRRWRTLYASAKATLDRASQHLSTGTLMPGGDEYRRIARLQAQANRQIHLLANSLGPKSSDLSEFYPYRYLAAEGFLPGYNFTRLPVRIFLPDPSGNGEFISRPRAVALREFGPLNIIYHNGRKYQVDQLVVQDAENSLTQAKVSKKAGYFLAGDHFSAEICPFSEADLGDNANKEHLTDLIEMTESRGSEIERISCEEEERVSRGFEIDTYFSVDGSLDRMRTAAAKGSGVDLLKLRFIPAARLVHLNRKWRASLEEGFPLGLTNGVWKSSVPPIEEQKELFRTVKLWTSNTADALYIEPIQPLGLDARGVITLQHALKRAIETTFQVESSEIGVVAVGNPEAPNILMYEASEGSLGILSRFADDPGTLALIARQARQICRFDDPEYKAPASYDDLLSYYNQRDHHVIDRFLIMDALDKLEACSVTVQSNAGFPDYDKHYQAMLAQCDPQSELETKFIEFLHANNLRLPDKAQARTPGIYSQPDFYYEPRIWVFVDGTVHDRPEVKEADRLKRAEIRNQGDEVFVYRYDDDLAALIASRPDIFRKVR